MGIGQGRDDFSLDINIISSSCFSHLFDALTVLLLYITFRSVA